MKYSNRSTNVFRKILRSPFTVVILLIICFILVKAAWNIHQKSKITNERLVHANEEIRKLEDRYKVLNTKVVALSTDRGIEAEMRTKYRAVKNGEMVAVIIDGKGAAPTAAPPEKTSFWKKILGLFY